MAALERSAALTKDGGTAYKKGEMLGYQIVFGRECESNGDREKSCCCGAVRSCNVRGVVLTSGKLWCAGWDERACGREEGVPGTLGSDIDGAGSRISLMAGDRGG